MCLISYFCPCLAQGCGTVCKITFYTTELDLGPVFDIKDVANPFQQLGACGCLPANFDVGNGTVDSIRSCSVAVEPIETRCGGTPKMGYYYQCLQTG